MLRILMMSISLIKISKRGFPNRKGLSLFRTSLNYWILGFISRKIIRPLYPETKNELSEIWDTFNDWLTFQIKYISPRNWARVPLIRTVSLVDLSDLPESIEHQINEIHRKKLLQIAERYEANFLGINRKEFYFWLSRYWVILNSIEKFGTSPLYSHLPTIEIGPGFCPISSILSDMVTEYHSIDSYQMQVIAKYIEKHVIMPTKPFKYYPTNLLQENSIKLDLDGEYALIAFYSFTEMNKSERNKYKTMIARSRISIFVCNSTFEGVNNFDYLEKLGEELRMQINFIELEKIFRENINSFARRHRIYVLQREFGSNTVV